MQWSCPFQQTNTINKKASHLSQISESHYIDLFNLDSEHSFRYSSLRWVVFLSSWVCVHVLLSLWRRIQHFKGRGDGRGGGDEEEAAGRRRGGVSGRRTRSGRVLWHLFPQCSRHTVSTQQLLINTVPVWPLVVLTVATRAATAHLELMLKPPTGQKWNCRAHSSSHSSS